MCLVKTGKQYLDFSSFDAIYLPFLQYFGSHFVHLFFCQEYSLLGTDIGTVLERTMIPGRANSGACSNMWAPPGRLHRQ